MTAAPDGGFLVLWTDEAERAVSQFSGKVGVEARRFAADGTPLWQTRIGAAQVVGRPMARATSNGFVVAWTGQQLFTMPEQAFLQLLAADGSLAGPGVEIGRQDSFPFQHQLRALPLPDGSILAVWTQGNGARQVYIRRYDAALVPLAAAVPLAGTETAGPVLFDAQVLATGDVGLVWSLTPPQPLPHLVQSAVVSPEGTFRAPIQTVTLDRDVVGVQVVPLGASGHGVVWDLQDGNYRQVWATLWMQRFDNAGVVSGDAQALEKRYLNSASATTGLSESAGPGFEFAGGADGHFVAVFNRLPDSTYLMGR